MNMRKKKNELERFNMSENFEVMQSLYDGLVFYNKCQEYHFVVEPEERPENVMDLIDMSEPFSFITTISSMLNDLLDGNTDPKTLSEDVKSLAPFERKMYAYLKIIPASVMKTTVLDAEGNEKTMFVVYALEKINSKVLAPLIKSKEIEFVISGKKCYSSAEKSSELV